MTFSHELLEILADPEINRCVFLQREDGSGDDRRVRVVRRRRGRRARVRDRRGPRVGLRHAALVHAGLPGAVRLQGAARPVRSSCSRAATSASTRSGRARGGSRSPPRRPRTCSSRPRPCRVSAARAVARPKPGSRRERRRTPRRQWERSTVNSADRSRSVGRRPRADAPRRVRWRRGDIEQRTDDRPRADRARDRSRGRPPLAPAGQPPLGASPADPLPGRARADARLPLAARARPDSRAPARRRGGDHLDGRRAGRAVRRVHARVRAGPWYPYTRRFPEYAPRIRAGAPAATAKRLGSYFPMHDRSDLGPVLQVGAPSQPGRRCAPVRGRRPCR